MDDGHHERSAPVRVWVDGREVAANAPAIAATDQGFTAGWAIFETLRIHRGRPAHRAQHARRLLAAAKRLGGPFPDARGWDDLDRALVAYPLEHGAARVALTAGADPAGLWPSAARPRRIVWLRAAPPFDGTPRVGTATVRPVRPGLGPSGLKTHAYLGPTMERAAARRRGFDEVLWRAPDGCVDEGATSNLFAVVGGRIVTPPLGPSVRPGVTRDVLLREGLPVELRRLTRAALASAEEVFVTSSIRGVMALVSIDGRPVGRRSEPGPAAREAARRWRAALDLDVTRG